MSHFLKIKRKPTIFAIPIQGYEADLMLGRDYILGAFGKSLRIHMTVSTNAILDAMVSQLDMYREPIRTETGCAQEA